MESRRAGLFVLGVGVALASMLAVLTTPAMAAPEPAVETGERDGDEEELRERLRAMEEELRGLREELERRDAAGADELAARLDELERQMGILTEELERRKVGPAYGGAVGESVHGLGPAASKVYGVEKGVSIGGYGEMLYEKFDSKADDGSDSEKTDDRPARLPARGPLLRLQVQRQDPVQLGDRVRARQHRRGG